MAANQKYFFKNVLNIFFLRLEISKEEGLYGDFINATYIFK